MLVAPRRGVEPPRLRSAAGRHYPKRFLVTLYIPSTPGKAVSVSLVIATRATLSPAPSDDRGASTLSIGTHVPQVRFGYHYEDTLWSESLALRFGFAAA